MTTLPVVLAVLAAGLSLTACNGQVVCEVSPCGDSAEASSTEGTGGSAGSGQDSAGGGAPTGGGQGGDGGGGSDGHAPIEGVACNFESPVWMGYVISAENMASGASDSSGAGRCEGWVSFEPEPFNFNMWDAEMETIVQGTANGATWYGDGCGAPHCATLTYGDGSITEQYCTVFALCENGVAHSVGFTW